MQATADYPSIAPIDILDGFPSHGDPIVLREPERQSALTKHEHVEFTYAAVLEDTGDVVIADGTREGYHRAVHYTVLSLAQVCALTGLAAGAFERGCPK